MGESATERHVTAVLSALGGILSDLGAVKDRGVGVAAANTADKA
jgi:aspartate aminotransferase-like enzyme